jgi:WD40 repeat protein
LREVDSQRQRAEDNFSEAGRAQGEAVRAKKVAEQERDAAYQNLYYADMRLGLVDWNAGNLARLTQKLRSYVPETGRDDLRGWEWYYFLSLCHQDERTLLEHRNLVTAVAWSPNGRYLASTSYDGTTKLWDAASWRLLQTFEGPKYLKMGVSWSPDSQSLAWGAAAEDSGVYVYQVPNGRLQTLRGHTSSVWTTAWSPDGKKLASAGIDQTLRIWEVASGSCLHVLKGFRSNIPSLAWHPDGIMLATAADEGLRIWDTVSGKIVRDTFTPSTGLVPWGSVAWSPDGRLLALAEQKCVVYRTADWSVATQWDAGQASCVVWKPDGKRLAAAGADGLIRIWDLAGPTCELTLRGHVKGVWSLTWEPSGRRLASGGMDATVKIWPVPPVPQPRCLDGRPGRGLQAIAWCEERDMLRSWDAVNGSIVLWNVATGERVSETPAPPGEAARFSSNGGLLAVADKAKEAARLLVCAARPGTPIQKINANVSRARKEWGTCLIGGRPFSPDASRLAFVSAPSAQEVEAVEIADLRGNEVLFHWGCVWPLAVSWSPKGRFLAIAGGGDVNDGGYLAYSGWIHVLDPEKRQRIWKLRHGTQRVLATALTWSPNDDALVSGDENGLAEVWDMGTGSKRVSTHLHTAKITSLAWSPGGPRVASGSADRTVRIWDPIRGEELLRFDLHAAVEQVEWSSDGCRLAAVDSDGKIHIWDASVGYRYVQSEAYSADQAHAANLKLK